MRERLRDLPRGTRVVALLVLVVPVALWLLLVWDTRPYSAQDIEADRARVEALPAYDRAVEDCWASWGGLSDWGSLGPVQLAPSTCEEIAFAEHTAITREPLSLGAGASLWVTLALAALAFLVGTRWPTGSGARALLANAGRLLALSAVTALAISLVWWWGLESVAEHRRLEGTQGPYGVAMRAAAFVGFSAVLGLACTQLLRGTVGRIVVLSVTATALGLVVLVARPVAPWLPVLNVRAFLVGDESYDIPRDQVVCTPSDDETIWLYGELAYGAGLESCTPDHRTRTSGEAALYLGGGTIVLTTLASLTRARRRTATQPG